MVTSPQRSQQKDCEQAYGRRQKAVSMLDEQVPGSKQPGLPGVQKEIVPVGRRPVWHRHSGIGRSHQTTHPNERERRARQHQSPAMRPRRNRVVNRVVLHQKLLWTCSGCPRRQRLLNRMEISTAIGLPVSRLLVFPAAAVSGGNNRFQLPVKHIRRVRGKRLAGNQNYRALVDWVPSIRANSHATDCGQLSCQRTYWRRN